MIITSVSQMEGHEGETFRFLYPERDAIAFAVLERIVYGAAQLRFTFSSQFDAKAEYVYLSMWDGSFGDENIVVELL